MQVQLSHIQKRGNSFYFRLAIPEDLQIHFGGKREISKTLRTLDPFTAFVQACELRELCIGFTHGSKAVGKAP